MQVDCDRCAVRGPACAECVVTFVLGLSDRSARGAAGSISGPRLGGAEAVIGSGVVSFEDSEWRALDVLADSGLVPPLRLVTAVDHPPVDRFRAG